MQDNTQVNKLSFDSPEAERALRFILQTNQSIFLTGKAGTGKTTLLKQILRTTTKNTVVVAPTGIAALNAGGVTIHSFFQLPFGAFLPVFAPPPYSQFAKFETKDTLRKHFAINKSRLALIRNLELLVIDEVSMLRADLLDAMDWMLRTVRKTNKPFGGIQVLFIGDLLQLPPVVKPEEWSVLKEYYAGVFFFHAKVVEEQAPIYIELQKVYRQNDAIFLSILQNLRNNTVTAQDLEVLSNHVKPDFKTESGSGFITLTTHNSKADTINELALKELDAKPYSYKAIVTGDFPPAVYPIEEELILKVGAQVMFVKNDMSFEKNYFNGKMGVVKQLSAEEIIVEFPEEKRTIAVASYEWTNVKYTLNESSGAIEEKIMGTFVHYPIRLAWAITVHKSQGLTFDKAVLDVSQVFAPGQAYVALSRLRSLEGLVLLRPISMNGLTNDQQVVAYTSSSPNEEQVLQHLKKSTQYYWWETLTQAFEWHDLVSKIQIVGSSYLAAPTKSEKGKEKNWLLHQEKTIDQTVEPAKKFQQQLMLLFQGEEPDYSFILQRLNAAFNYFFTPLDQVYFALVRKQAEWKKEKKNKGLIDELNEVAELILSTILRLNLAVRRFEAFEGNYLEQDKQVDLSFNQKYKFQIDQRVAEEVKPKVTLLDELTEEPQKFNLKKSKAPKSEASKVKQPTTDITLELLQEGLTLEEIATKRQLSTGTIFGHFSQLIALGKLQIEAVIEEERLKTIVDLVADIDDWTVTLSSMKEKLGDKITFEELKCYQAHCLSQNN